MGKLYEEIFWLNRRRNGGSTSAGMVAQSKTEWWLNLSGLGAQRTPEYSFIFGQVFTSSNEERKQAKREELFVKVWEKPVTQVATE